MQPVFVTLIIVGFPCSVFLASRRMYYQNDERKLKMRIEAREEVLWREEIEK